MKYAWKAGQKRGTSRGTSQAEEMEVFEQEVHPLPQPSSGEEVVKKKPQREQKLYLEPKLVSVSSN